MKAQSCVFKRTEDSVWEDGVAVLSIGFDTSAVMSIIDSKGLTLKKTPWNYQLKTGPLCYIDTSY